MNNTELEFTNFFIVTLNRPPTPQATPQVGFTEVCLDGRRSEKNALDLDYTKTHMEHGD